MRVDPNPTRLNADKVFLTHGGPVYIAGKMQVRFGSGYQVDSDFATPRCYASNMGQTWTWGASTVYSLTQDAKDALVHTQGATSQEKISDIQ